jgi:hypothetical protein
LARTPPAHAPWLPAKYELAEVMAMKALADGSATADQQKYALAWIINVLCGTYDMSFRPEGDRETIFAEGKRFAGLQLVKLLNLTGAEIEAMRKKANG